MSGVEVAVIVGLCLLAPAVCVAAGGLLKMLWSALRDADDRRALLKAALVLCSIAGAGCLWWAVLITAAER